MGGLGSGPRDGNDGVGLDSIRFWSPIGVEDDVPRQRSDVSE